MVATSEKFKELFNNVKKDETDEETSKILVAAYEREEGLESVPTRSLRALIKSLKEKAFSFLDDNTLSPSYVLKKWLEPEQGPSEEDEPDKTPNQAPEKESDHKLYILKRLFRQPYVRLISQTKNYILEAILILNIFFCNRTVRFKILLYGSTRLCPDIDQLK